MCSWQVLVRWDTGTHTNVRNFSKNNVKIYYGNKRKWKIKKADMATITTGKQNETEDNQTDIRHNSGGKLRGSRTEEQKPPVENHRRR